MAPQSFLCVASVPDLRKVIKLNVIALAILCVLLADVTQGSEVRHPREKRNANTQQQTTPSSGGDLTDIIRHLSSTENMLGNLDLMQYTPSTPSPEDVNCYVEVPVTRRVGGRCVSLGSNAMGCQAGVYLALSSQCQAPGQSQSPRNRLGRLFNRRRFSRRHSGPSP
ncbi:hypothetical protein EGW08_022440 [Elysia chlorotica]|uniref:Uncharacterized protein n=1 Tax=Elysia chlorotica TaxID=188477 RepID=A0A433SKY4_ELYCH|nr:hypothetical protein EGW08_022440 [Elysia chlorotica]